MIGGFLVGVKVIEFGGIGLGLYVGMVFVDLGVDVVWVCCLGGLMMLFEDCDLLYCGKWIVDLDVKM